MRAPAAALHRLARRCSAVVVCRCSPAQKALVVKLIEPREAAIYDEFFSAQAGVAAAARKNGVAPAPLETTPSGYIGDGYAEPGAKAPPLWPPNWHAWHYHWLKLTADDASLRVPVTLAIGDGANDVSMIRAARVGVGIAGQEGMQAVRSSDFAVQRFSDLEPLLLGHGRLAYVRLGQMTTYFFYKNIVATLSGLWFGAACAWSGPTFFVDVFMMSFNMIFTLLPPFIFAVFEQDLPAAKLALFPATYCTRATTSSSARVICYHLALAFVHSVILMVVPILALGSVLGNDAASTPTALPASATRSGRCRRSVLLRRLRRQLR